MSDFGAQMFWHMVDKECREDMWVVSVKAGSRYSGSKNRGGQKPYFDKHSLAEDAVSDKPHKSARSRKPDGSMFIRKPSGWAVEEQKIHRGTLWNYGKVSSQADPELTAQKHPARFHLKLALDVVTCFCPPSGIVCDPFTGSGTTGVAALSRGRSFIGGDLFADDNGVPWAESSNRICQKILQGQDNLTDVFGLTTT